MGWLAIADTLIFLGNAIIASKIPNSDNRVPIYNILSTFILRNFILQFAQSFLNF